MSKPEVSEEVMLVATLMAQIKLNLLEMRPLVGFLMTCPHLSPENEALAQKFAEDHTQLFETLGDIARNIAKENNVDLEKYRKNLD